MKLLVILTAILSPTFMFAARIFYERKKGRSALSNTLATTAVCLYVSHVVLTITTIFGYYSIPWFLLFLSILVYCFTFDIDGCLTGHSFFSLPSGIILVVAAIAMMISTVLRINNEVTITTDEMHETSAIYITNDESSSIEIIDEKLYLYVQKGNNSKCTIIVDLDDIQSIEDVTYITE